MDGTLLKKDPGELPDEERVFRLEYLKELWHIDETARVANCWLLENNIRRK